MHLGFILLVC